jgi:hypothetical protein
MKKFFKYTAITLVILVLVFLSLGVFSPGFSFQNKVIVDKPLSESFMKFIDPTRMKDWIPGYKDLTWISGFPMTPGSKWKIIVMKDGKNYEIEETLIDMKMRELFAFHLSNSVLESDVFIHFKAMGNRTEILVDNKVKGKNMIWRSLFVFFRGSFPAIQQETYDNLKKSIEK